MRTSQWASLTLKFNAMVRTSQWASLTMKNTFCHYGQSNYEKHQYLNPVGNTLIPSMDFISLNESEICFSQYVDSPINWCKDKHYF